MTVRIARIALTLLLGLPLASIAQQGPGSARALVFIDCQAAQCDLDYFRTEIPWVSYVRDRSDADVHVLVTGEPTGGGGREYTLAFLGRDGVAGMRQTLKHHVPAGASDAVVREGVVRVLRLGLLPYATAAGTNGLEVRFDGPPVGAVPEPAVRDPWNNWTVTLRANGSVNGEDTYFARNVFGSLYLHRITEAWKLSVGVRGSERVQSFEYEVDGEKQERRSRNGGRGMTSYAVRSLTPHLSAGVKAAATTSTYLNQALHARAAPAVEYNVYPYAESTRRQMTFQYSVGPRYFEYEEETIFGKMSETLVRQEFGAALISRQPWGSVNVGAEASSYLDDLSRNRLVASGGAEFNLVRGLSLDVSGTVQRLRDQIYLPAGELDESDILLRQRQLATDLEYWGFVGFSYTLGSRAAPVVNRRMREFENQ